MGLQSARTFDLHLHTTLSDGRLSPEALIETAANRGLDAISITDHDLSCVVQPGVHKVDGRELHVIAGAEISGMHAGREYHLLAYFPGEIPDRFRSFCRDLCKERASRYQQALDNLGLEGIDGPDGASRDGQRALTRTHLAQALVASGHANHMQDAFNRFIGYAHGTVPTLTLKLVDAIAEVRACGGLTSWAHPPMQALKAHGADLAEAGLQGLEAFRPSLNSRQKGAVRKIARRHGMFCTGGSDWHGWHNDDLGLFRVERSQVSAFLDALAVA